MATEARQRRAAARPLDVDTLWRIERIGAVALAPDGQRAVCTVARPSMADNRTATSLWLLATEGAPPRRLTQGGSDTQPAWSPRGDRIAFVARREQQGRKDSTPQLYLIAPDGGEAARAAPFAPGVESFRWLPDGRRIVFAAWVWPGLKGAAAQQRRHRAWSARKESGYATSEAFYRYWDHNVPEGRVLHLLLLDLASGRVRDLFEGTPYELPRSGAEGRDAYDIRADGRRIAFVHDPAPQPLLGNRLAIAEIEIATRAVRPLLDDAGWDFGAPRYSPDGKRLAATAAPVARSHTAQNQLALREADGRWSAWGEAWDRSVEGPLRWADDGASLLFAAEDRGRRHLWRHRPAEGRIEIVHAGGWVQDYDAAGSTLVVAADSAAHPVRVTARRAGREPLRIERFNDALLARVAPGERREITLRGAQGDPVQLWLTLPPRHDGRRRQAVLQVLHGGPHAAAGDTFGYRWNTQVLAGADRVVAQLNFHGSSGFGQAFNDSLNGRQGELELQDIEAASDWLLAQRWCDPRRLYAAGGSYGGFLAAWINGQVPAGRYRALVCHAGVFDRVATFSADSWPVRPKDLGAKYWEDLPRVLAQSPATHAAQMQTPTLVIHGARDYRVPDCNGLAYYNTLKARGVDARLLWFPDENHWILKPRNSRLWYREVEAWLERHGGAAPRRRPQPK
ncbi:MAG: S9 family peptidase [Burkholderiales bacterium]|nr:S9 family peptidase [Burkholderiales bacterium]MDE1926784.1 S9 family peptidase [Burkholderiales bacterium]MDE2158281.1 S9 family peptidase [Burkholderiales bacterium]MDE2502253.1 S9 family peptidase [Burkholderiales bacterium]